MITKATIRGQAFAEASDDEIVVIEGNVYFPSNSQDLRMKIF